MIGGVLSLNSYFNCWLALSQRKYCSGIDFMDTDDLSIDAYEAVLVEAEKFLHELTPHFAVLAEDYENEDEYLAGCKELISEYRQLTRDELSDYFFENEPTLSAFRRALDRINKNISKVLLIPLEKRTFHEW